MTYVLYVKCKVLILDIFEAAYMRSERLQGALRSIVNLNFDAATIWNRIPDYFPPDRDATVFRQFNLSGMTLERAKEKLIEKFQNMDASVMIYLIVTLRNQGDISIAIQLEDAIVNCTGSNFQMLTGEAEQKEVKRVVVDLFHWLTENYEQSHNPELANRVQELGAILERNVWSSSIFVF